MHALDAAALLDTSPDLQFSVWISCGGAQPDSWRSGYAAVILDDGVNQGAGMIPYLITSPKKSSTELTLLSMGHVDKQAHLSFQQSLKGF